MARYLKWIHLFSFFICTIYANGPDYKGTEFIIGFMENYDNNNPVELFITTLRTVIVNVHVSAPLYTLSTVSHSFSVTSGVVKYLPLDRNLRMLGTNRSTNAVLITADDEIVVYGLNKAYASTDAYLSLPTDVLGTKYYIATYTPTDTEFTKSEVMLIGIQGGTQVSITLPSIIGSDYVTLAGSTYSQGETFNVSLNRYETFQFQSTGDLTGTLVSSSKPIALLSGNKCTLMDDGACDHIVEMLPPIDTWGKKFVTVPIPGRTVGDKFRFISSEPNTIVQIQGGVTNSFILRDAGDMIEKLIPSTAYCYITSDKAIMVMQFVRGQRDSDIGDPSMMIVQPVGGYSSFFTFTTPKRTSGSYNNFFAIVIKNKDKNGLKLDDVPISTTFHNITGTDYVGGYIHITEGAHTVRHDSPIVLFAGYLYGTGDYETYAFPIGMRLAPINTVCIPSTTIVGDGLDNDCDGLIDEELCTLANGRKDDDNDGRIDEDCAIPSPIDGGWGQWGHWSSCSQSCKPVLTSQTGVRTRVRPCDNPLPQYDGKQCPGNNTDYLTCSSSDVCPENIAINSTYRCQVGKCPNITIGPFVPVEISLLMNLTCDSIDIHTSVANGDQFLPQTSYSLSGPEVQYFHIQFSTNTTAFITLITTRMNTNEICYVEITPTAFTQREMACIQDGKSVRCPDKCTNPWNFQSPCRAGPSTSFKYAHPSDITKYLECDVMGNVYIVHCPQNMTFSESCQQCSLANTTCLTGQKNEMTNGLNPCTVATLMAGNFFFSYPLDISKFIHCDVWGKAWIMSCPVGEVWEENALTCIIPTTTTSTTTPRPVMTAPSTGTGFTCCTVCSHYTAPCTSANIAAGKLLHPIREDKHHYIQCDLTGRMYCPMPCNPSVDGGLDFFDPNTSTCVDGSIFIDSVLG